MQCIEINPSVCLSAREHISGTAGPIGTKCCVRIPCGCGSVLRRRCATLCISRFMDDSHLAVMGGTPARIDI